MPKMNWFPYRFKNHFIAVLLIGALLLQPVPAKATINPAMMQALQTVVTAIQTSMATFTPAIAAINMASTGYTEGVAPSAYMNDAVSNFLGFMLATTLLSPDQSPNWYVAIGQAGPLLGDLAAFTVYYIVRKEKVKVTQVEIGIKGTPSEKEIVDLVIRSSHDFYRFTKCNVVVEDERQKPSRCQKISSCLGGICKKIWSCLPFTPSSPAPEKLLSPVAVDSDTKTGYGTSLDEVDKNIFEESPPKPSIQGHALAISRDTGASDQKSSANSLHSPDSKSVGTSLSLTAAATPPSDAVSTSLLVADDNKVGGTSDGAQLRRREWRYNNIDVQTKIVITPSGVRIDFAQHSVAIETDRVCTRNFPATD